MAFFANLANLKSERGTADRRLASESAISRRTLYESIRPLVLVRAGAVIFIEENRSNKGYRLSG